MVEDTTDAVERGYDALAAAADGDLQPAASPWGDSHFQRHYSWPATRRVLPDVAGRRVLLAGCGRGDHVPWFAERAATVTGVDLSRRALRAARERYGDRAAFARADLTAGLAFRGGAFDLVLCNLVLSHVREWEPVFTEFHRVLRPGGTVVVATVHPRYVRSKADVGSYAAVGRVDVEWSGTDVPTYYRPTSAVLSPVLSAGFRLSAVEEPEPREAFGDHHPERYEAALESPELLVLRADVD